MQTIRGIAKDFDAVRKRAEGFFKEDQRMIAHIDTAVGFIRDYAHAKTDCGDPTYPVSWDDVREHVLEDGGLSMAFYFVHRGRWNTQSSIRMGLSKVRDLCFGDDDEDLRNEALTEIERLKATLPRTFWFLPD